LCKYQFVSLGLGASVETALVHETETVSLLLITTMAGCDGKHFSPFPSEVKTIDAYGKIIKFNKSEGGKEIKACLELLPAVTVMKQLAMEGKLKVTLQNLHPLLYLLVMWIINTSNCHLHYCKPEERIAGINTEFQWIMKTTQPDKEKYFYKKKKKARFFLCLSWFWFPKLAFHT